MSLTSTALVLFKAGIVSYVFPIRISRTEDSYFAHWQLPILIDRCGRILRDNIKLQPADKLEEQGIYIRSMKRPLSLSPLVPESRAIIR